MATPEQSQTDEVEVAQIDVETTSDAADADEVAAPASGEAPAATDPAERHPDIAALPYEQARDELVSIVARLESGQTSLEDSMALWERGEALAAHCSRWLDGAEARLEERTGAQA